MTGGWLVVCWTRINAPCGICTDPIRVPRLQDFLASRLTRVQTARAAVLSYPYYPDSVAILHAVVTGGRRGDKGDRGAGGSANATATAADANGDVMRDA